MNLPTSEVGSRFTFGDSAGQVPVEWSWTNPVRAGQLADWLCDEATPETRKPDTSGAGANLVYHLLPDNSLADTASGQTVLAATPTLAAGSRLVPNASFWAHCQK